jgi:VanZ family protein
MEPSLPPPSGAASLFGVSRTVARFALFGGILLVCLIAFNPHTRGLPSTGWDKLNHMLAFSSLGLAAWWAYPTARRWALGSLLVFGVLIEVVQTQIPGHTADAADLLADLIGLAVAVVAARLMRRDVAPAGDAGP